MKQLLSNEDKLKSFVAFIATYTINNSDSQQEIITTKAALFNSFVKMANKILDELYK